jgi:P27 family predicted phage terminase small subunit
MPVGRKNKPTALKILQGNPGKRKLNKHEPQPSGVATCPSHLDAGAKAEWKRVAKELKSIGLLTSVDRAAMGAYCCAYSRWAEAEKQIQKIGTVIRSPKSGFPIANPHVSISNTALDLMRKFCVEFGLTPASRTRLQVEPAGREDPFAEFMAEIGANDPIDDISDSGSTPAQAERSDTAQS